MELTDDIRALKGVGEKTAEVLNQAGIFSLMDLILYFPRDYEKIMTVNPSAMSGLDKYLIRAEFISAGRPVRTRTGKTMVTLSFMSGMGQIKAMYFNMPYIGKSLEAGREYNLYGKFKKQGNSLTVPNPKLLKDEEAGIGGESEGGKIIARYPLKENLTDTTLRKLINQVLQNVRIRENLPLDILKENAYPVLDEALRTIHNPDNENFDKALERMKFQELFSYSLKIAMAKDLRNQDRNGIVFTMSPRLKEFRDNLPYELTKAQSRAIREILLDQKKDVPMNRLLQGDVGSGKTIVALTALFNIIENGYQGVLMAPTEILAQQHFQDTSRLYEKFGIPVRLLTGSLKAGEKNRIKAELQTGLPSLLIGTHAVIEDDVQLPNLGLIVTDEQHRFGVNQRLRLIKKQKNADVLVMSATPIPRTLALYLYSDLDLSVLDELPPGRQAIETRGYSKGSREKAYQTAKAEIARGRQVYIVCPLIEDNEEIKLTSVGKLYEELKTGPFSQYAVEMIHGGMKGRDKTRIMESFKAGAIQVLISTTVIEVGVNVPNASVMIIENSERFGLSQLHQLRGRVGRGDYKSYCLLISDSDSETGRKRLDIITGTTDGFKIAEADLNLRGTGAIFGTNQSGDSGLVLSNFIMDYNIFTKAAKWAAIVYNSDKPEYMRIKQEILNKLDQTVHYICLN